MLKPEWKDLRVVNPIGNGAGTLIYRVVHLETGRVHACKHVTRAVVDHIEDARQGQTDSSGAMKRSAMFYQVYFDQVRNEFEILNEFSKAGGSPHIVQVHELRTIRRMFRFLGYDLLIEYVEGKSLREDPGHPMRELLETFRQTAQGLVELHRAGIVHADMKPHHIVITSARLVKLLDFGQSCHVNETKPHIQGTPEYMAYEQLKGQPVDFRTDIYGLGATMYWAFTGKLNRPALTGVGGPGGMDFTISYAGRSRCLRDDNPNVPKEVDELVVSCCERRPEKRPQTMREVWEEICRIQKSGAVPESV
jgi:serine/threonine protein kinase